MEWTENAIVLHQPVKYLTGECSDSFMPSLRRQPLRLLNEALQHLLLQPIAWSAKAPSEKSGRFSLTGVRPARVLACRFGRRFRVRTRMRCIVDLGQMLKIKPCVNLCGRDVGVPQ